MVCSCEVGLLSLERHCLSGGLHLLLRCLQWLSGALKALLLLLHWLPVQVVSHLLGAVTALGDLVELLQLLTMILSSHLLTLLLLLLWLLCMWLCLCLRVRYRRPLLRLHMWLGLGLRPWSCCRCLHGGCGRPLLLLQLLDACLCFFEFLLHLLQLGQLIANGLYLAYGLTDCH